MNGHEHRLGPAAGNGPQSTRVILVLALRSALAFKILSAKPRRRAANLDERPGAEARAVGSWQPGPQSPRRLAPGMGVGVQSGPLAAR